MDNTTQLEEMLTRGVPKEWFSTGIQYKPLEKRLQDMSREMLQLGLTNTMVHQLCETGKWFTNLSNEEINKFGEVGRICKPMLFYNLKFEKTFPQTSLVFIADNGLMTTSTVTTGFLFEVYQLQDQRKGAVRIQPGEELQGRECATCQLSGFKLQLRADVEFFAALLTDLSHLRKFEMAQKSATMVRLQSLGQELGRYVSPHARSRGDMDKWRTIFKMYMEAEVFISHKEGNSGINQVGTIQTKLDKLHRDVSDLLAQQRLRNPKSQCILAQFWRANDDILNILKLRNLNLLWLNTLLDELQTHTGLRLPIQLPEYFTTHILDSQAITYEILSVMELRILLMIPQIEDYLCPVCTDIAMKPVRLQCTHVFCIRCIVKLQRSTQPRCPICRDEGVEAATEANIDTALFNFLKLYFPTESTAKLKSNIREVVREKHRLAER